MRAAIFFFFLFIVGNAQLDEDIKTLIEDHVVLALRKNDIYEKKNRVDFGFTKGDKSVRVRLAGALNTMGYNPVLRQKIEMNDTSALEEYCKKNNYTIQGSITKPKYVIVYTLDCDNSLAWSLMDLLQRATYFFILFPFALVGLGKIFVYRIHPLPSNDAPGHFG